MYDSTDNSCPIFLICPTISSRFVDTELMRTGLFTLSFVKLKSVILSISLKLFRKELFDFCVTFSRMFCNGIILVCTVQNGISYMLMPIVFIPYIIDTAVFFLDISLKKK